MRRVHLRGHANILKRLLIHSGTFNLGLLMRQLIGVGTPRGLQGRLIAIFVALMTLIRSCWPPVTRQEPLRTRFSTRDRFSIALDTQVHVDALNMGFTTGC